MKRLIYIFTVLILVGCEVIDEAHQLIPVPMPEESHRTHVLIEYTGFRCVNCPVAAQTAQNLQSLYGDQLIVVAMHPPTNPFTQGKFDYTCPEADSCYLFMGGEKTTAFPTGNIDIVAEDGKYFTDMNEWSMKVAQAMEDTVAPNLYVEATLDTLTREVSLTMDYTLSVHARMAVWIIEDSVKGVQAMPDGSVSQTYYHRHLLRTAAYGTPWGVPVTGSTMHTSLTLPDICRPEYCDAVALLLDPTNYKILQAYETKLVLSSPVAAMRKHRQRPFGEH